MLTTRAAGTSSDKGLQAGIHSPDHIPLLWPDMEKFVRRSVEAGRGEISVDAIYAMLVQGHAVAFSTHRNETLVAVLIARTVNYSHYRAFRIIACAGRELRSGTGFFEAVEAWALREGAVEIEAWCRPAMTRLLMRLNMGWKHKYAVLFKDLRSKLQ